MLVATLWLALLVAMPGAGRLTASPVVALAAGRRRASVVRRRPGRRRGRRASAPAGPASRCTTSAPPRRWTPRRPGGSAGVDADARAYLLLRPYLKRAVRVEITDPADPAPYWLVSTRHADALAGPGPESGDRETGTARPLGWSRSADRHRSAQGGTPWLRLEGLDRFSLVAALGAAAVAKKALDRSLEGRHRQEPAGEPRRPRRRRLGGRGLGRGQRHAVASPGCSPPARPPSYYAQVDRPPAARPAEGRPGRRRGGDALTEPWTSSET